MATSEDQEKGSSMLEEMDLRHFCSPCKTDRKQVNAVGNCLTCEENLCQRCFDVHLIPSVTRKHQLVNTVHIPTVYTDDEDIERISRACPQHSDEVINYHCPSHSFLGCHFCSYNHQKSCRDVLCIPDVCKDLKNTTEYKDFADKLAGVTKICMHTATEFKDMLQAIESSHTKVVAEIREFKNQLLDAVENAEQDLLDKANTIKDDNLRKANELNDKSKAILEENQKLTATVNRFQRSETDLYISMMKTMDKLRAAENEINSVSNTIRPQLVSFKANTDLLKYLNNEWEMGTLTKYCEIKHVEHKLDINIKSGTDTITCGPVGSVLCSNNLVITDEGNRSVKLVNVTSNKLTSELKLYSTPLGVCKISESEVAVALQKKVVFLKTGLPLLIERDFVITKNYHGLGYCDRKLVLSYASPSKIEVLDMRGNVLNTFVNDDQGHALFYEPFHLTVNPENKRIYVSNYSSNTISCMTLDGTVVAKYTDSELKNPMQVITDVNGMVYICGRHSHNIIQLTQDCEKVKVLLTKPDGLIHPESISYDETHGNLYVGQANSYILKVYTVT